MEIKINKSEALTALKNVLKAVPRNTTMPILTNVRIKAADGKVTFLANDMSMAIEATVAPAEIAQEGKICVNAQMLTNITAKLPDEDVLLKSNDKVVEIESGRTHMSLPILDAAEFPEITEESDPAVVTLNGTAFAAALNAVVFAVSQTQTSTHILSGVNFAVANNALQMTATDGFRIALKRLQADGPDMNFTIPAQAIKEIARFASDKEEINLKFKGNNILFKTDDISLSSRLLSGKYIDANSILKQESKHCVSIENGKLRDALERAIVLNNLTEAKKPLIVRFEPNKAALMLRTSVGNMDEVVAAESTVQDAVMIGFNPQYMIDIIKNIDLDVLKIGFSAQRDPLMLKGEDFEYLLLPTSFREEEYK